MPPRWGPVGLLASLKRASARSWTFHYENILGTSLALRLTATSQATAQRGEQAALAEIVRLEAIFSGFNPESELRRWQGRARLSPELSELLRACELWKARTSGAFDVGGAWSWDGEWVTRLSNTPITLNAIAKGEIVDRACAAALASSPEVFEVVVNIGGDLVVRGEKAVLATVTDPRCDAQNAPPLARVWLKNQALATSGIGRRGLHLYDPRTGKAVEHIVSASVIASTVRLADVLSTAFSVLTPQASLVLAESEEGVACLLVTAAGTIIRSPRWAQQEVTNAKEIVG